MQELNLVFSASSLEIAENITRIVEGEKSVVLFGGNDCISTPEDIS